MPNGLYITRQYVSGIVASAGGGGFQTASDNFSYSNGALLGSQPNWTNSTATTQLTIDVNGAAKGFRGTSAGNNSVVLYNQLTWSANQYAQVYAINVNGPTINNGGAAVRCDAVGGGNSYYAIYSGGNIYVNRCNSGTHTAVATITQAIVVGNGIRLSVTGTGAATRLNVTVDTGSGFTTVAGGSNIDPGGTYISSGSPGVASYDTATSQGQWGTWLASEQ